MNLLLFLLPVLAFSAPAAAPNITGSLRLAPGFNISWTVAPSISKLVLSLSWDDYDWAAIGLHPTPGEGMPNAEIFMCHAAVSPACQVRSSANGYMEPAIQAYQYIEAVASDHVSKRTRVTFTRDLVVPNASSSISVPISDKMLGLIFARGSWAAGHPNKHEGTAGRWQANFFHAGAAPEPAPPTPTPSPPGPDERHAGVWPVRFDARLRMAPSQVPTTRLHIKLGARLRYDYPGLRQRWEYWDVEDKSETPIFAETWINYTLYEIDYSKDPPGCSANPFQLEILRPDWPVHMKYVASHYLDRQPPANATASGVCYTPYSELTDLFQDPAPIGGMTNNWLVFNSSIAEPLRLEGPDDFKHPTWLTIQDYTSFKSVPEHDPKTFDVPSSCKPALAQPDTRPPLARPLMGRLRPHFSNEGLLNALSRARSVFNFRKPAEEGTLV